MKFGFVPPPIQGWDTIHQLLDKAVTKGGNDWEEVEAALESGHAQLWLTVDGGGPVNATVTRKDGNTIEVWLCGGRVLPDALHFLEVILKAASKSGMTNARIVGRKGWSRALAAYGWQAVEDELVKDIA
jgi:hypothetical protein